MQVPLLNALKTFIVSAQRLNFTKASEDLLVSPSAISHQIKILEDYLGYKLFYRKNRTLSLTQEGKQLFTKLEKPFQDINQALVESRTPRGKTRIHLSLRPFISSMWLNNKIDYFLKKHPLTEIHLIHSLLPPNFQRDHIKMAIVWGKYNWQDYEAIKLIPGDLTPICSTEYLNKFGPFYHLEDLRHATLLHEEDRQTWNEWFEKKFNTAILGQHNIYIDDTNVRLQSVRNHQGIMLGCPSLLKPYLDCQELVQLFDVTLHDYAYFLIYPKSAQFNQHERAFIEWLTSIAMSDSSTSTSDKATAIHEIC
ncbi:MULTISPECIES: LysR family transcriptional regulator [unclassified Acinetobacter]|uniref:LysR family transcriptional regulator n=1 Tax=unclassified Acinetobacter TaxID=196816 RepID=UPI0029352C8E|nr:MULTISPECIES: LysR family transcriptional regulator [unclassified Acinetobacter]WOE32201.1 LysR substrate-binding domain-containing protein [Acinetobacter sp. SAAs470]WOE37671.1 LysR substrate-binding domain-containing protein [Acinetobacter sp. SAAs474]